ncbi:MAG TPA: hypothetical protein VNG33_12175, partial [Polyangiaceae bacterium]|nr:hypothetical protein [Polyangiaceae bacterium]
LLGGRDAFIAKLKPDGTLAWAKNAGGTADDAGRDVQVAADGSLRVVGIFEGTGLFGAGEPGETQLQAKGKPDMFVAKLADDGTLVWVTRAGAATAGGGTFGTMSARVAPDASLRVLGSFSGTVSFGPGEANETSLASVAPAGDMFLASYTPDGTLDWVQRIEGTQLGGSSVAGRGVDFRVDQDGTTLVVVTGNIKFAPGQADETVLSGSGVNIAKYDASGALLDAQTAGGGGRLATAVLADDGSLYVGGLFNATITFGSGQAIETTLMASAFPDSAEMFLAKLAPSGELAWAKQATIGQKGALNGLGVMPDGSFRLLAQYFLQAVLGPGELQAVKLTMGSCLIANYDADGSVISGKDVSRWHSASNLPPAPPFTRAFALSAKDGSMRVVGYAGTTDPITLGEGEPGATVISGASSWMAKYDTCP